MRRFDVWIKPEENIKSNSLSIFAQMESKRLPFGRIFQKKERGNQDFTSLNNSKDTERGGVLLYEKHFNCL